LPRPTSRWRYSLSVAHVAGRSRASMKERARSCASQVIGYGDHGGEDGGAHEEESLPPGNAQGQRLVPVEELQ
jgi:hypothetical protein